MVNLSDNGAGRSEECVPALKYQMLPLTDIYVTLVLNLSTWLNKSEIKIGHVSVQGRGLEDINACFGFLRRLGLTIK
jgi:hypothetical protein